ncbi:hypothetical protein NFX46_21620 [Streptomyces phaeoluteigriseus]|uniref:Uncharacterized protein n=1 Tax=Streptomyces phaeoluteigriseus TaxID=114686 RepID=A0ABY4ZAL4_9ACTN|nr:hypothetical protein [Streptomyces phaeoluteigriseus]USQ86083.1 hypothetical protein NFX46_21620 [Streptomyces phaeoluteigriseus]
MATLQAPTPPRRIVPGDVVAAFSEYLGEWTAAQITHLDPDHQLAGVLHLDWSGPEPTSVADLGEVAPLSRTRGSFTGQPAHCHYEWVLPRSYKVIGTLPLLHEQPPNSYAFGWGMGLDLTLERRRQQGDESQWSDPWAQDITGTELNDLLAGPADPDEETRRLTVRAVQSLDCARLVERYPALTGLTLIGPVTLSSASSLNELTSLKRLMLSDVFGMAEADCLLPRRAPALESLELVSVPAEYATAMKRVWRPEEPQGVYLRIAKPRKPEWLAENLNNPLRDWDGREQISAAIYKKALAQYKATRRAVLAVLASGHSADVLTPRLVELGEQFGEAFNELDERAGFIETVEREELYDALDAIITEAEAASGADLAWAGKGLTEGCESVRDW